MTRRALLIGSPGEPGADNFLKGVAVDIATFQGFLRSPLGGAWKDNEVVVLRSPSTQQALDQLAALTAADYSVVLFSGHGHHLAGACTHVERSPGVELSSDVLRTGATKHTLVMDCCRMVTRELVLDERKLIKSAAPGVLLDEASCRASFDDRLSRCAPGIVVLYSCRINEVSHDSAVNGGYYCSSLLASARDWHAASNVDTSKCYDVLSVTDAHDRAEATVQRKSGNRQNPTSEYPRSTPRFPFAIVA